MEGNLGTKDRRGIYKLDFCEKHKVYGTFFMNGICPVLGQVKA